MSDGIYQGRDMSEDKSIPPNPLVVGSADALKTFLDESSSLSVADTVVVSQTIVKVVKLLEQLNAAQRARAVETLNALLKNISG